MKVEVADPNTSRDDFYGRKATLNETGIVRAQELCESQGGRPGLPVRDGFLGRKAKLKRNGRSSR